MKQLNKKEILNKKIGEILGMKVKFKNEFSGRMKTGFIVGITKNYAEINDNKNVNYKVLWNEVYD